MSRHDVGRLHPGDVVLVVFGAQLAQPDEGLRQLVVLFDAGQQVRQIKQHVPSLQHGVGAVQSADQVDRALAGFSFGAQQVDHGALFARHELDFAVIGQDGADLVSLFHDIELRGHESNLAVLGAHAKRARKQGDQHQDHDRTRLGTKHVISPLLFLERLFCVAVAMTQYGRVHPCLPAGAACPAAHARPGAQQQPNLHSPTFLSFNLFCVTPPPYYRSAQIIPPLDARTINSGTNSTCRFSIGSLRITRMSMSRACRPMS